jgi:copper chaperone CopZ
MKKINLIDSLIIIVLTSVLVSCTGKGNKPEKESVPLAASAIEVSIGGMTCVGCEETIQRVVGKLEGVKSVKASFTVGNAIIEYYPGMVDSVKIKEAINGSGYTAKKFIIPQSDATVN